MVPGFCFTKHSVSGFGFPFSIPLNKPDRSLSRRLVLIFIVFLRKLASFRHTLKLDVMLVYVCHNVQILPAFDFCNTILSRPVGEKVFKSQNKSVARCWATTKIYLRVCISFPLVDETISKRYKVDSCQYSVVACIWHYILGAANGFVSRISPFNSGFSLRYARFLGI